MAQRWQDGKRICRGDYRTEADLEHGTVSDSMWALQPTLPTLPVPDLDHTLQLYLDSIRPLATPEEFERTARAVKEFLAEGGIGQVLQKRLLARAQDMPRSSWLQEWWNLDVYLLGRTSLVIDYNFFFHFADDPHLPPFTATSGTELQVLAAARLLQGTLQYRDRIVAGTAPPEKSRDTPCCTAQWKYLFNACRVPRPVQDEVHLYDPTRHDNICVLRYNRAFTFPAHGPDGHLLSTTDLATQLRRVVSAGTTAGPSVGILTASERDTWAAAREQLVEDGNEAALEAIQSSILVLCLDDCAPVGNDAVGRLLLHGGPAVANNRWYDKSLQLVVFENGKAGLMGEHSMMDAMPAFLMMTAVLKELHGNSTDHGSEKPSTSLPQPIHHAFQLSLKSLENVYTASRAFDDRMNVHDLAVLHFGVFGAKKLKDLKVSPDSFAQMAIQLAATRLWGSSKPTYESTSIRQYAHSRTETTRSLTVKSQAWTQSMQHKVSPVVQARLLLEALQQHNKYTRLAAKGLGCDRHLLGLRRSLKPGEYATIFDDPMYQRSRHWNLSTSALGNEQVQRMGFGEVVPDGLGVCYNLKPNGIDFTVTSRDVADRWAPGMVHYLQGAMLEMRYLLETARSLPQSRL